MPPLFRILGMGSEPLRGGRHVVDDQLHQRDRDIIPIVVGVLSDRKRA